MPFKSYTLDTEDTQGVGTIPLFYRL